MDWWVWRLVVSTDIPDGLAVILREWSFADTLDAHLVLDSLEEVRDVQRAEARERAEQRRRT